MPPNNKKKVTSSKKKLRREKKNKSATTTEPTASDIIAAAKHAAESDQGTGDALDPFQAISLYDAALEHLQQQQFPRKADAGDDDDDDDDKKTAPALGPDKAITGTSRSKNIEDDESDALMVQLLEKRAEAKVSVSDQDGARVDYQQALELLLAKKENLLKEIQGKDDHRSQGDTFGTVTTSPTDDSNGDDPTIVLEERIASLHLYMGQLSEGRDALQCYENGIQALQSSLQKRQQLAQGAKTTKKLSPSESNQKQSSSNNDPLVETRQQLSAACCNAAEVYLTDLCFDDNAEQLCESWIQQALQYTDADGETPTVDALQTAASLRLSQSRNEEAMDLILRCYNKIQVGCRALAVLIGIRESNETKQQPTADATVSDALASQSDLTSPKELTNVEAVQSLPGFESRCQTAKILLECAGFLREEERQNSEKKAGAPTKQSPAHTSATKRMQCAHAAIDVLASLMAENDEVIEVWFLLGDAYAALYNTDDKNDNDASNSATNSMELAQHYWSRTLEMLQTVKESLEEESMEASSQEEEDDIQQQLDEILCQMDDVRNKLSEVDATGGKDDVESKMQE